MFNKNNHNEIASESGFIVVLLEKDFRRNTSILELIFEEMFSQNTYFMGCDFRGLPSGKLT